MTFVSFASTEKKISITNLVSKIDSEAANLAVCNLILKRLGITAALVNGVTCDVNLQSLAKQRHQYFDGMFREENYIPDSEREVLCKFFETHKDTTLVIDFIKVNFNLTNHDIAKLEGNINCLKTQVQDARRKVNIDYRKLVTDIKFPQFNCLKQVKSFINELSSEANKVSNLTDDLDKVVQGVNDHRNKMSELLKEPIAVVEAYALKDQDKIKTQIEALNKKITELSELKDNGELRRLSTARENLKAQLNDKKSKLSQELKLDELRKEYNNVCESLKNKGLSSNTLDELLQLRSKLESQKTTISEEIEAATETICKKLNDLDGVIVNISQGAAGEYEQLINSEISRLEGRKAHLVSVQQQFWKNVGSVKTNTKYSLAVAQKLFKEQSTLKNSYLENIRRLKEEVNDPAKESQFSDLANKITKAFDEFVINLQNNLETVTFDDAMLKGIGGSLETLFKNTKTKQGIQSFINEAKDAIQKGTLAVDANANLLGLIKLAQQKLEILNSLAEQTENVHIPELPATYSDIAAIESQLAIFNDTLQSLVLLEKGYVRAQLELPETLLNKILDCESKVKKLSNNLKLASEVRENLNNLFCHNTTVESALSALEVNKQKLGNENVIVSSLNAQISLLESQLNITPEEEQTVDKQVNEFKQLLAEKRANLKQLSQLLEDVKAKSNNNDIPKEQKIAAIEKLVREIKDLGSIAQISEDKKKLDLTLANFPNFSKWDYWGSYNGLLKDYREVMYKVAADAKTYPEMLSNLFSEANTQAEVGYDQLLAVIPDILSDADVQLINQQVNGFFDKLETIFSKEAEQYNKLLTANKLEVIFSKEAEPYNELLTANKLLIDQLKYKIKNISQSRVSDISTLLVKVENIQKQLNVELEKIIHLINQHQNDLPQELISLYEEVKTDLQNINKIFSELKRSETLYKDLYGELDPNWLENIKRKYTTINNLNQNIKKIASEYILARLNTFRTSVYSSLTEAKWKSFVHEKTKEEEPSVMAYLLAAYKLYQFSDLIDKNEQANITKQAELAMSIAELGELKTYTDRVNALLMKENENLQEASNNLMRYTSPNGIKNKNRQRRIIKAVEEVNKNLCELQLLNNGLGGNMETEILITKNFKNPTLTEWAENDFVIYAQNLYFKREADFTIIDIEKFKEQPLQVVGTVVLNLDSQKLYEYRYVTSSQQNELVEIMTSLEAVTYVIKKFKKREKFNLSELNQLEIKIVDKPYIPMDTVNRAIAARKLLNNNSDSLDFSENQKFLKEFIEFNIVQFKALGFKQRLAYTNFAIDENKNITTEDIALIINEYLNYLKDFDLTKADSADVSLANHKNNIKNLVAGSKVIKLIESTSNGVLNLDLAIKQLQFLIIEANANNLQVIPAKLKILQEGIKELDNILQKSDSFKPNMPDSKKIDEITQQNQKLKDLIALILELSGLKVPDQDMEDYIANLVNKTWFNLLGGGFKKIFANESVSGTQYKYINFILFTLFNCIDEKKDRQLKMVQNKEQLSELTDKNPVVNLGSKVNLLSQINTISVSMKNYNTSNKQQIDNETSVGNSFKVKTIDFIEMSKVLNASSVTAKETVSESLQSFNSLKQTKMVNGRASQLAAQLISLG